MVPKQPGISLEYEDPVQKNTNLTYTDAGGSPTSEVKKRVPWYTRTAILTWTR